MQLREIVLGKPSRRVLTTVASEKPSEDTFVVKSLLQSGLITGRGAQNRSVASVSRFVRVVRNDCSDEQLQAASALHGAIVHVGLPMTDRQTQKCNTSIIMHVTYIKILLPTKIIIKIHWLTDFIP